MPPLEPLSAAETALSWASAQSFKQLSFLNILKGKMPSCYQQLTPITQSHLPKLLAALIQKTQPDGINAIPFASPGPLASFPAGSPTPHTHPVPFTAGPV